MNKHVSTPDHDRAHPVAEAPSRPAAAPAEKAPDRAAAEKAPPRKRKGGLKRLLLPLVLIAVLGAGAYYGHHWWTVGRFMVSTDDAYVAADVTTLVAKVGGYVSEVPVPENAHVETGDVLLRIDPGDFELAVQAAKDKITAQDAAIARIGKQVEASRAAIDQAQAQVEAARAEVTRTEADFERAQTLVKKNVGSQQALDAARAARDSAKAQLTGAQAGLAQAKAALAVTRAEGDEAQAAMAQLKTSLASAERDLSFTTIRAPSDGVVGNRAVEIGSFVAAGTRLMALVPMQSLYVEANFKETQIGGLHEGQEVDLNVDALPDTVLKGRVESIAPASGSVFSLLPAQNATGNFTKVVQRVPVRIAIVDPEAARVLRPGLSVVVDVDTRTGGPGTQAAQAGH